MKCNRIMIDILSDWRLFNCAICDCEVDISESIQFKVGHQDRRICSNCADEIADFVNKMKEQKARNDEVTNCGRDGIPMEDIFKNYHGCRNCKYQPAPLIMCDYGRGSDTVQFICKRWEAMEENDT